MMCSGLNVSSCFIFQRMCGYLVALEPTQFQHLLVNPEFNQVEIALIILVEQFHLVLAIGIDDGLRQVKQHLHDGVVESQEIVGVGNTDFREISLFQMSEHNIAVLVVVHELVEIRNTPSQPPRKC